ncbi:MAG: hypothetical protein AB7H80_07150 [Candidatus Kapaibacterium sp.]
MFHITRAYRLIAAFLAVIMILEVVAPATALALTGGSAQDEFAGGGGGGLVNPFTGQFSYSIPVISIPGPNGAGYGMTLDYGNNTNVESEASWVGLGWSLNAGAINRIKQGYPDDYNNQDVIYWDNARTNKTTRVTLRNGAEVVSSELLNSNLKELLGESAIAEINSQDPEGNPSPLPTAVKIKLSTAYTLQYNNYTGYDHFLDFSGSGLGASANLQFSENGTEVSGDFSPATLIASVIPYSFGTGNASADQFLNNMAMKFATSNTSLSNLVKSKNFSSPSRVSPYGGITLTGAVGVAIDGFPLSGFETGVSGSYTTITAVQKNVEKVFGFLYSSKVPDDTKAMDYTSAKEDNYTNTDRYLPFPLSNADYFVSSGTSGAGSFRAYQRANGYFRPAFQKSKIPILHFNVDIKTGGDGGVGVAAGGGSRSVQSEGWTNKGLSYANDIGDGESVFFRFNGDRGGSFHSGTDDAVQLTPEDDPEWKDGNGVSTFINNSERVGRSAYVSYTTNGDLSKYPAFDCSGRIGIPYRAFSRRWNTLHKYVNRSDVTNGLGEFAVVGSNGSTYIYGLPVYSRGEVNMSYGLYGLDKSSNVDNEFLAYKTVTPHRETGSSAGGTEFADNEDLKGTEYPDPYATTFLLTEIVTPDYVDRTNNGPTPDDLGGYVIFNYAKDAGTWNKSPKDSADFWYKWRYPYRGLAYSRNSHTDPHDDAGSFSYGYKEIYYLESIETKTHKAIFHTSSRKDGYEAPSSETLASGSRTITAADPNPSTNPEKFQKLQKLDKIELWSKDANGNSSKLLSTTNFDYDYTLCTGLPNAENSGGKLTLKRVWFEYEGVVSARVSPYEFGYQYPVATHFKGDVPTQYSYIVSHGVNLSASEQNPNYSPVAVDRWGQYQYDGGQRYEEYKTWVNQVPDEYAFDPAAWQLKWIKLPSGGEIHVQYEQQDYQYVQHRRAMVMAPLTSRGASGASDRFNFELNLDEVGITDNADKIELEKSLKNMFLTKGEYIYFKFLYAVEGTPDLSYCTSEYISGYAAVSEVYRDPNTNKIYVKIGDVDKEKTLPDRICKQFYKAAREGILNKFCGEPRDGLSVDGESADKQIGSALFGALQAAPDAILKAEAAGTTRCSEIDLAHSYLRIPVVKAKRGGGIRVKRILTYDPGLEEEDIALYGTEYIYKLADGSSSGVATNEPSAGREENGLIQLGIQRLDPLNTIDTVISGKSMRQLEEPVGEALLPSPSIGYSRVIAQNIHTGKSGTGFTLYEFHTAREYPFDLSHSSTKYPGLTELGTEVTDLLSERSNPFPVDVIVFGQKKAYMNATQGYRFVINSMHGQTKSVSSYSGTADPETSHTDNSTLTEQVRYEYYQPGEPIPVMYTPTMDNNNPSDKIGIDYENPGKIVETLTESRKTVEFLGDVNLQSDFALWLASAIPFPVFSGVGRYQRDKQEFKSHVTTKVISYPAIVKSVTATKDGVSSTTEYVAFDPKNGGPVVVKTSDGYDGLAINSTTHTGTYYSMNIPAWQHYSIFDQIASTQFLILKSNSQVSYSKRYIQSSTGDEHYLTVKSLAPGGGESLFKSVVSGDLIELKGAGYDNSGNPATVSLGLYNVGVIAGNRIQLHPVSFSISNTIQKIDGVDIEIVKSGRNNRAGASVGGLSTYGSAPSAVYHPVQ